MMRSSETASNEAERSIRSVLEAAADEAQRRRRLVRTALAGLGGVLVGVGVILLGALR